MVRVRRHNVGSGHRPKPHSVVSNFGKFLKAIPLGGLRRLILGRVSAREMRLGLRRAAYGEPDATAFHGMPRAAESLKAERAALFQRGATRCATLVRAMVDARKGEFPPTTLARFLKQWTFERALGGSEGN
jgi:hypothetical protein